LGRLLERKAWLVDIFSATLSYIQRVFLYLFGGTIAFPWQGLLGAWGSIWWRSSIIFKAGGLFKPLI